MEEESKKKWWKEGRDKLMEKNIMIRLLVKEDDVLNTQFALAASVSLQSPEDSTS